MPLNLGGFSPRYVKYVWCVAADSGTNLESCWQPHKRLGSCRGVGSKQAGMFSAHTGKAQGSPDPEPASLAMSWQGFRVMTEPVPGWCCAPGHAHTENSTLVAMKRPHKHIFQELSVPLCSLWNPKCLGLNDCCTLSWLCYFLFSSLQTLQLTRDHGVPVLGELILCSARSQGDVM